MKKIILVLSVISMIMLSGCGSKDVNQIPGNNDLINNEMDSAKEAKNTILNALRDSEWVKENVSMKEDCFGNEFTGNQTLTFEILNDDLVIVQAYSYNIGEENKYDFGVQVFLVGYKDGEVKVKSLPENGPAHPGHGGFGIDSKNMVLVDSWMNQGSMKNTAYRISNLMFEEIETISLDASDESYDEHYDEFMKKVDEFNQKYETHQIDTELTEENLNNNF